MSPALEVLANPRTAFPRLAETPSLPIVLAMASVWGVDYSLREVLRYGVVVSHGEPSRLGVITFNIATGIALGLVVTWLAAWAFAWFARRLGGTVTAQAMRTILAWSMLPHVATVLLSLTILLVAPWPPPIGLTRGWYGLPLLACSIYSVSLAIIGLAAAARLSTGRTIAAYCLGGLVVAVPVVGAAFAYSHLAH